MALFQKTFERLRNIVRNAQDLGPLAAPVRDIILDANRDRAMRGLDFEGRPYVSYAPLAPSTLADRRRKGFPPGPPLNRQGSRARIITKCEVSVRTSPGRVSLAKSWPELPWMEYHIEGTPRMPRRDPLGYSTQELAQIRALLHKHVKLTY